MNELKKKLSNSVKGFVENVIEEADQAEAEERYFNKGVIGRSVNELHNQIDLAFIEFEERVKQKKGRLF